MRAAAGALLLVLGACSALTIRSSAECVCQEEARAKCTTTGNEATLGGQGTKQ